MRILFTAAELEKLAYLTELAARTHDMIFGTLAQICDRCNLQWDPDEADTDGLPVRDIVDDYASNQQGMQILQGFPGGNFHVAN